MKVAVTITELTADEQQAVERRLAEFNYLKTGGSYADLDDAYTAQIAAEITERAALIADERVAAQRALGEILVQLPADDQKSLINELVTKAEARGIDTSKLT